MHVFKVGHVDLIDVDIPNIFRKLLNSNAPRIPPSPIGCLDDWMLGGKERLEVLEVSEITDKEAKMLKITLLLVEKGHGRSVRNLWKISSKTFEI